MSQGPLAGVRVIEVGQLLAGPFCGQMLADFGAEVIKIEQPVKGDPMRAWGRVKPQGHSLWWPIVARNKKSVTLDMRRPEGQDAARRLIDGAAVLVENFRPGTLERWDLAPQDLLSRNPRLVITRVSGYGQEGPYSARAGYGSIGEAMGGIRYVTGDPGSPPSRVGISLGDSLTGLMAAYGTVLALRSSEATGRGQIVDAAIFESVLALMESVVPEYELAGIIRERSGAILPGVAPSNVYPTSDHKSLLIAANMDRPFQRLAQAMDRPELAEMEKFATHDARGRNQVELDELISDWTSELSADDLVGLLEEYGVPAGYVYRAPEMIADPHFNARESIVRVRHKDLGQFPMQNVFPRLSETPGLVSWPGPSLGQHNHEVLNGELGFSDDEIEALQ